MTAYLEKNQTKLNLPRDTKLVIMFVKADIDKNTIAAEIVINKYEIHTDRKEEISEKTKKVLIHCFKVTSAIVSVETADGTKVFC